MEQKKSLTVQTLHAVVDWVVQSSGADCCQLCAYYNKKEQLACSEDIDCCGAHRRHGDIACREGIIEKVQMGLTEGGAQ